MRRKDSMISKPAQYRIYAGTKKRDYTGWTRLEGEGIPMDAEVWTLDLGDGYFLDSVRKSVKKLFSSKEITINSIRRDLSDSDPDGDFRYLNFSLIFNVNIMIGPDAIKFDNGNNSFVVLSREPVDWNDFSEGMPEFDEKGIEQNWRSFYS